MKVSLDKNKCMVCGSCVGLCPAVFEMADDGSIEVRKEMKDVPSKLEGDVQSAADACPATAITVEK